MTSVIVQRIAFMLLPQYILLAILYGFVGDWRRFLYWTGATLLTLGVTL